MTDTGTIIIARTDDPRSEYPYQMRLDLPSGGGLELLAACQDYGFRTSMAVFDCESTMFYAEVYNETTAADIVTILMANKGLLRDYGMLVTEVWA